MNVTEEQKIEQMKKLRAKLSYALCTLLVCVLFTSCKYSDNGNIYELEQFRGLKPPVIVIGTGTVRGDARIIVKDSAEVVVGFNDNGFRSAQKGDTLLYAH